MPDLRWEDAASWLEPDGSLLDGVITSASVSDWQTVIDLVRPKDLQSQAALDVLCHVLRTLGRKLGKPVILTPEGMPGKPLAAYDPGSGRVSAIGPNPRTAETTRVRDPP